MSENVPQKLLTNAAFDISFIKTESGAKVLHILTTGQLNMAILPIRYAIKSTWYDGREFGIRLKLGKYFEYLVSLKSKEIINISNIRLKKIGMIRNSGSELVLNQYLRNRLYTKQYLNSVEVENILFDKNIDGVMMDSSAFSLLPKKKKDNVIEMNAGHREAGLMEIIEIKNLYYCYFKGAELFSGYNYQFKSGEIVLIKGPSGKGKSTLAAIMAGHLLPHQGEIIIDGKKVTGPNRHIMVVHQENDLFLWLSVHEN